ncbi:MAG: NAD(P)H-hydrate dehydratase [Actinomycetota bacterium]|nr:NAD(P)H-hydrate dehydratase [Actinomycetota bacterium]
MRTAHAVADVRAAERDLMALVPDGELMRRAAAGLAAVCVRVLGRVYGARVAVLAGAGDNGGDALFAGARLAGRGARVTAIATGPRLHEAGARALTAAGGTVLGGTVLGGTVLGGMVVGGTVLSGAAAGGPGTGAGPAADVRGEAWADAAAAIGSADLILDGILGIGGHGGLREPAAELAGLTARARAAGAVVVAVDLPSGVDADTGEVAGAAVAADLTVTFGTIKPGLLIDPGAGRSGAVELVDIGLRPHLAGRAVAARALQAEDVTGLLPAPGAESNKYRRGVLGVLAGSERYTGAAVLSVGAAVHGGAGMVRLVSAARAADVVRQHWPEAVITEVDPADPAAAVAAAGRVQAWAAGPGLGTGPAATAMLGAVLATPLPVLLDADALTVLAGRRDLLARPDGAPTVITPHAGELSRLIGADIADIEARRAEFARRAAADLGVTVLLKGSTTVVATPDPAAPVLVNPTGTAWLATAGSGDVLTGLTGALLAQGVRPVASAAAAAAYLHGLAGRLAASGAPIGASDLLAAIGPAIRVVTGGSAAGLG